MKPFVAAIRFGRTVARDRAVLVASVPFIVASFLVGPFVGWHAPIGVAFWSARTILMAVVLIGGLVVVTRFRTRLRRMGAREAYHRAWKELRRRELSDDRLMSLVLMSVLLPVVAACFTAWKVWLNNTIPFTWDSRLALWDRVLHGGVLPSQALLPLLHVPGALEVVEILYDIGWGVFVHAVLAWQALRPPSLNRSRFLVSFGLAWPLAGVVAAGLLMSAGPCYYGSVVQGENPYAEYMAELRARSEFAVPLQEHLWRLYSGGGAATPGGGISAMPSLHVLTVTLVALVLWPQGWRARIVGVGATLFTLFGSVFLSWHYAVDGYLAIGLALLLWFGVGWVIGHRDAQITDASSRNSPRYSTSGPERLAG